MRILAAVLLASLSGVAAAQVTAPQPGAPDFSSMLAEISPGLPESPAYPGDSPFPIVADVSLPPLLPTPDPPVLIDIGAHYELHMIPSESISHPMTASDEEALQQAWVVNINAAPENLLARMPLLDPMRAIAIARHRESNGPFERPEDLADVFGISEETYARLAGHITCSGPSTFHGHP